MAETEGQEQPRRSFDWNLLHTFMVIVQEGSITRAAERLLYRQPTVSNALRRLEEQLGKRLVDRGPGRFELTEHGSVLYRECQEICGSIGRLRQLLDDDGAELTGHLTIHMASHVAFSPLDETLAEFHARHPKVSLDIDIGTSSHVIASVLAKQATLGICLVHEKHPRLDYRLLYREHFGFFCGPRHRLFRRRGLSLEDLGGENFVSFRTDQLTDALRPVAMLRAQLPEQGPTVGTSSNLEEVRRMIVAGLGIGPLPIHVVEREVRDELLWRLPPYEEPPAVDIYVVTNPRATLGRAERLFLDALIARSGVEQLGPLVLPGNRRMAP
ncbi:LysR family transcriptional regulator [Arhodomonas sp. SL1]|uniref:LysR family transcriptional regulator n=1 Tax=Arhodomonas sp. SL1 TaxID=3425691 RepID=UPI003F883D11